MSQNLEGAIANLKSEDLELTQRLQKLKSDVAHTETELEKVRNALKSLTGPSGKRRPKGLSVDAIAEQIRMVREAPDCPTSPEATKKLVRERIRAQGISLLAFPLNFKKALKVVDGQDSTS